MLPNLPVAHALLGIISIIARSTTIEKRRQTDPKLGKNTMGGTWWRTIDPPPSASECTEYIYLLFVAINLSSSAAMLCKVKKNWQKKAKKKHEKRATSAAYLHARKKKSKPAHSKKGGKVVHITPHPPHVRTWEIHHLALPTCSVAIFAALSLPLPSPRPPAFLSVNSVSQTSHVRTWKKRQKRQKILQNKKHEKNIKKKMKRDN